MTKMANSEKKSGRKPSRSWEVSASFENPRTLLSQATYRMLVRGQLEFGLIRTTVATYNLGCSKGNASIATKSHSRGWSSVMPPWSAELFVGTIAALSRCVKNSDVEKTIEPIFENHMPIIWINWRLHTLHAIWRFVGPRRQFCM